MRPYVLHSSVRGGNVLEKKSTGRNLEGKKNGVRANGDGDFLAFAPYQTDVPVLENTAQVREPMLLIQVSIKYLKVLTVTD